MENLSKEKDNLNKVTTLSKKTNKKIIKIMS